MGVDALGPSRRRSFITRTPSRPEGRGERPGSEEGSRVTLIKRLFLQRNPVHLALSDETDHGGGWKNRVGQHQTPPMYLRRQLVRLHFTRGELGPDVHPDRATGQARRRLPQAQQEARSLPVQTCIRAHAAMAPSSLFGSRRAWELLVPVTC